MFRDFADAIKFWETHPSTPIEEKRIEAINGSIQDKSFFEQHIPADHMLRALRNKAEGFLVVWTNGADAYATNNVSLYRLRKTALRSDDVMIMRRTLAQVLRFDGAEEEFGIPRDCK